MATLYTVLKAPSDPTSGMGANLLVGGKGASFRVWAPNASAVRVRLKPTDAEDYQDLPLSPDASNPEYFSADIGGAAGEHQYRFSITNNGLGAFNPGGLFERVDPYARDVETSDAASPGFIVDPGFSFASFQTPSFDAFIIYQFHIGSFAGLNDGLAGTIVNRTATFRQIADNKLDRIRRMNFNAVAFLPTAQTPYKTSEGYAPANFFAPEVDYGDPDDLRYLVDQCHRHGLAVIFDVVYNHVVPDAAYNRLLQFDGNTVNDNRGIYFSEFDNFGPVPDFDREEVIHFFEDNARQCFREFNADGIRFDSAHAIRGKLRGPSAMSEILAAIRKDFPNKFLIAEHDNPTFAVNTLGFDASWDMGVADRFINTIDSGPLDSVEALVTGGNLPHSFNLVRYLLGSHDQIFADYELNTADGKIETDKPLNRYFVERVGGVFVGRNDFIAQSKARMGWALNIAMPCTPMLFMGTECHHFGYWDPKFDSYGEHRFNFALVSDLVGQPMNDMVRDANQLRSDHPALRGDLLSVTHRDPQNRVLGFKRWNDDGDVLLIVLNMSVNQWDDPVYGVSLGGEGGRWEEVFNSQAPQYGGWNNSGNFLADLQVGGDGQIRIRLPKWSVLVFRKR
jgi:1,4-alpha-glucan branching enzyme